MPPADFFEIAVAAFSLRRYWVMARPMPEQTPVPTTVSTGGDIVGETEGVKEKAKRQELD